MAFRAVSPGRPASRGLRELAALWTLTSSRVGSLKGPPRHGDSPRGVRRPGSTPAPRDPPTGRREAPHPPSTPGRLAGARAAPPGRRPHALKRVRRAAGIGRFRSGWGAGRHRPAPAGSGPARRGRRGPSPCSAPRRESGGCVRMRGRRFRGLGMRGLGSIRALPVGQPLRIPPDQENRPPRSSRVRTCTEDSSLLTSPLMRSWSGRIRTVSATFFPRPNPANPEARTTVDWRHDSTSRRSPGTRSRRLRASHRSTGPTLRWGVLRRDHVHRNLLSTHLSHPRLAPGESSDLRLAGGGGRGRVPTLSPLSSGACARAWSCPCGRTGLRRTASRRVRSIGEPYRRSPGSFM